MEKYFEFKYIIDFLIPLLLLIVIFIIYIISAIIDLFKHIFYKNCYNCKHYKLNNVASCGDRCCYKCSKHNRIDSATMNQEEHYEKCKYFKED